MPLSKGEARSMVASHGLMTDGQPQQTPTVTIKRKGKANAPDPMSVLAAPQRKK